MANEQIQDVQENAQGVFNYVAETTHKVFLAGLGVVGMAQDQVKELWKSGDDFAGKLVERGETLAKGGRERVDNVVETRQGQVKGVTDKAGETFDKYTDAVLTRAHIPTADDIDALSKKLNSLNRKLDKVIKEQAKTA